MSCVIFVEFVIFFNFKKLKCHVSRHGCVVCQFEKKNYFFYFFFLFKKKNYHVAGHDCVMCQATCDCFQFSLSIYNSDSI